MRLLPPILLAFLLNTHSIKAEECPLGQMPIPQFLVEMEKAIENVGTPLTYIEGERYQRFLKVFDSVGIPRPPSNAVGMLVYKALHNNRHVVFYVSDSCTVGYSQQFRNGSFDRINKYIKEKYESDL